MPGIFQDLYVVHGAPGNAEGGRHDGVSENRPRSGNVRSQLLRH